ncbi:MAG: 23S rRNA (guanosine(2251)-2'-O)-methyltransferase RlmB [Acidimicrobiales bacterium]
MNHPPRRHENGRSHRVRSAEARPAGDGRGSRRRDPGERDPGGRVSRRDLDKRGARGYRRGLGGEQVEGRQAVRELLATARRPVRQVWIAQGLEPSPQLDEIARLAARSRAKVEFVGRRRLEAVARTDSSQGVLALAAPLEETPLEDMCDATGGIAPFLLVLDGVSDPQNLGAILRSAECAGVTGVVVPRHRAANVTPTVTKVAAGAVEHMAMAVVPGVPSSLRHLSEHGVTCVGLDANAETSLFDVGAELDGPVALVLGAEGRGLGMLSRRRCSIIASIPQHGALDSLNVAAACAVACFELARRRSSSRPNDG